ncbi:hypothetical protein QAD02_013620 [Eretmocerus hayati]|uniref:Uncharacterized protein n=1 Tax=Eretmocerus hayati TaxID=131215 RepID=A0ACC2P3Z4_9HYME|nr:hypothetical protein QAD02_013620 [Eretmocerus hayati]
MAPPSKKERNAYKNKLNKERKKERKNQERIDKELKELKDALKQSELYASNLEVENDRNKLKIQALESLVVELRKEKDNCFRIFNYKKLVEWEENLNKSKNIK